MKAIRLFPFAALLALVTCCASTTSKKAGETTSEPVAAAAVKTPVDVKSFGLLGDVKDVSVVVTDLSSDAGVQSWQDSTQYMSFDEKGRVMKDHFDNLYQYDDKGNFIKGVSEKSKMKRDEKGRIVYYDNWLDDEDDMGFTIEIEYDGNDRMSKVKIGGWEATVDQTYAYTGDNVYPDSANWETEDEGDHYSSTITYTYKKFDSVGNWTEREVKTVCKHTTEDDPKGEIEESKTLEQREIRYYQR
ncbi:MAG: hypothetical protein J5637_02590 [Prevotella sp.]|nr:hypothetical protein [Prevotella sp.]